MTIADGRKIAIQFTQPLVGTILGNETKFVISFDEYEYVPEGKKNRVTRPVSKIEQSITVDTKIDLMSGSYDGLTYSSGKIMLDVDEPVYQTISPIMANLHQLELQSIMPIIANMHRTELQSITPTMALLQGVYPLEPES